ncbi:hypothetical protein [Pyrofollis japonicus]|uniref:hypothetical protein n=1 Tax=Pyrofollis japonicus TaxID=3060460 RepID=UPI00295A605B|nr:hypothetical protein [Pyrofollis japonicus]
MPVGRKYTPYRRVLEELKLKQLDVYRYKDHDEIRALAPGNKVILIKLPKRRDEMTLDEFREAVRTALRQA